MQPSTLPSHTISYEDQGPQCWKNIEAETDYPSYTSFLGALPKRRLQSKDLLGGLNQLYRNNLHYGDRGRLGNIFVLDILKDAHTSISLGVQMRLGGGSGWWTQILQHLR